MSGEDVDLEFSWLTVEVSQEENEAQDVRLTNAPLHTVGTAIRPLHRVIQVCIGAEHGILRTDAGIAFTWGDNRYGQLGRVAVLKEENGTPYPVLDLLDEEIVMVAAGKNHCLALTAEGNVSAWGRNKQGQLGLGNFRDKTAPKWVRVAPNPKDKDETGNLESDAVCPKLGGKPSDDYSIVTISAGGNSSIAAARNSDVWQWGEINTDFKPVVTDPKAKSKQAKDKEAVSTVSKNRPFRVAAWKEKSFRTGMRKEKVSISESLCSVLDNEGGNTRSRLKDLVEEDHKWRNEIKKERRAAKLETMDVGDQANDGEADGGIGDLNDTIAYLERDIDRTRFEIDTLEKNKQSCEQQQQHNTRQIEILTHQATKLTESQGQFSQQLLEGKKSGQQKKQMEQQLSEIKDFIDANANTRATLLDQRAETDKEKQRLSSELQAKQLKVIGLQKRLDMVKFLGSNTKSSSGASDKYVNFLDKEKNKLVQHFEGKGYGQHEVLEAKKKLERDDNFLRQIESRVYDMLESANGQSAGSRPEMCKALLDDLILLRRNLSMFKVDHFYKEDLDFTSFFKVDDEAAV